MCAARSTSSARWRSRRRAAHNMLMSGPPGSGKTLLARALPSILPPLTPAEALEVTKIYSVGGHAPPGEPLVRHRPFRAPHHTISHAGLVGGGRGPGPARSRWPIAACSSSTSCRSSAARAGGAAPAAGGPHRHHQPRPRHGHLPRQLHAGGGDESLPLRLRRRPRARVHLLAAAVAATRSASPARCWTASTSMSRCRAWTTRS